MHTQLSLNHLNGGFVQQSSVLATTISELSQHAGQTNHDFFVLHFQALIVANSTTIYNTEFSIIKAIISMFTFLRKRAKLWNKTHDILYKFVL